MMGRKNSKFKTRKTKVLGRKHKNNHVQSQNYIQYMFSIVITWGDCLQTCSQNTMPKLTHIQQK